MRNGLRIAALAGAVLLSLPFAACGAKEERASLLPELSSQEEIEELPAESPAEFPAAPEPYPSGQEDGPDVPDPLPQPPPPPEEREAVYVSVLVNGLNVRAGAGTDSVTLGRAEKGTLLKCAGKSGNWYETFYRGKTAYVSAEERYTETVKLDTGSEKTEKIIEEGVKLLGTPYVYGAVRLHDGKGNLLKNFTAARFDCSSLMQYIFYQGAGILLDVNTRTQIKQGEKVAWEDIRRGDLLFFTNASRKDKTGIERVGHVALYLGGNYILHTASDFAKIEQITPLRKSYFIEGRRVT